MIADFAVGTIFVFATSLNIGIAVGLGCIIFGAIIGAAAYMLSEPKSEVTVEQTPLEKIVPEEKTIAHPA